MSWSRFFRRRRWDQERSREIEAYLQIETDENIARGMSPEDALLVARKKLGNRTLIREEIYQMNTIRFAETLWQDLRHGARLLRLNLGFAIIAIASLALGIGANTAIFQLLDAVRMRTLPVKEPEQLAGVKIRDPKGMRGSYNSGYPAFSNPLWEGIRDRQQAFSSVFAWAADTFNIAPSGEARNARGLFVSGEFFEALGVQAILGRMLAPADDQRGCGSPGVVLSYGFWQSEFGGSAAAIGRKLTIEGRPYEVVGIAPASFFGLDVGRSFDVAVPLCSERLMNEQSLLDLGSVWWLAVMGRLKPGWSMSQADASLTGISAGVFEATLPAKYPPENIKDYLGYKLATYPAGTGVSQLRDRYSNPLWLLLAIAAMVLLIACANLANLMLARASAREREIAVRLAIGASRMRVIRQLLAESLLLAVLGAAAGALLAQQLTRFLISFLSTEDNPLFVDLAHDWRVLAFMAGLAILTCVLFGLTPALRATRTTPGAAMKSNGRGLTAGRERFGLRRVLVSAQIALSLVLLVGALLFSRSLRNLLTVDAGFQQDGVLIAEVNFQRLKIPSGRRVAFKRELIDRLGATPGVESAADVLQLPLDGSSSSNEVWIDGTHLRQKATSHFNHVSSGYFKTLGVPLLAGRDFDQRDTPASPKVAVVDEAFARRFMAGANPVGKIFRREATPSDPEMAFQIIGLVKNTKYLNLREDFGPIAFLATSQDTRPGSWDRIVIRSHAPLADLVSRVKGAIGEVSPQIIFNFETYKAKIGKGLMRERLMATLSGFFGLLAGLLAIIGLYGVMAYVVAQRRNEIGIRMALGADRRGILNLILREAGMLLVIGLGVGTALALGAARPARSMLFGLQPYDPVTLILAIGGLALVAVVASYVPARRAASLDPMAALRDE